MVLYAEDWKDYQLLDIGNGEKLERWGNIILRRPDPQAIWPINPANNKEWESADAHYIRSSNGGGNWEFNKRLPEKWNITYGKLKFQVQPTGFKHTGLFPEQAVNWNWLMGKISNSKQKMKILNLFAYTGGATVACASAGAEVCHVDAAKGMVNWAKENLVLSGFADKPVRFIVDDVKKFVQREERRSSSYDGIIMDPPSYGRGPKGELWKIEDELYGLVNDCVKILANKPSFFLINSYTTGFSPIVVENILKMTAGKKFGGKVCSGEVVIPAKSGMALPCGIFARWEA